MPQRLAIGGLAVILLAAGCIASVIIGDGVVYVEPGLVFVLITIAFSQGNN